MLRSFYSGDYEIQVNCYHIHIYKEGKLIWKRTPDMKEWLDKDHELIAPGLNALEKILK